MIQHGGLAGRIVVQEQIECLSDGWFWKMLNLLLKNRNYY